MKSDYTGSIILFEEVKRQPNNQRIAQTKEKLKHFDKIHQIWLFLMQLIVGLMDYCLVLPSFQSYHIANRTASRYSDASFSQRSH